VFDSTLSARSNRTASEAAPILASGTVDALIPNGLTLDTKSSHGYIHVYTTSSTTFAGTKPQIGQSVYANGTGSWSTAIQATAIAQPAAMIQASGTIVSTYPQGFTLSTGFPHGSIRVYTSKSTVYSGAAPAIGQIVSAYGPGSWSTSISAMSVNLADPSLPPNGVSTTELMPDAKTTMGLFQVFDVWGEPRISPSEAQEYGDRYGVVWGARVGMPVYWRAGNSKILNTYYMPLETDANTVLWGNVGHSLSWWQRYHPDWILYSCTSSGAPTEIPAYISGLPDNVPLDIHNPDVVSYQVRLAASYALVGSYNGLAIDEVLFYNPEGAGGSYGCGIYSNGTFIRRYSSATDARWKADVVAWVKTAHAILTTDRTIGPHHLKLVVNHPAGLISDVNEQAIIANVDADVNESGFSDYGRYKEFSSLFKTAVEWARYAQAHGVAPLIVNKYVQSAAVSAEQLEYSIATYLMANEGGAGLFTSNAYGYGVQQYHSEYATNFGARCGGYYGGASYNSNAPDLWYRKYANAFVIVNSGSATRSSELALLPSGHTYRDLEGRTVSNPLSIESGDAYVLLTTDGCK
jgi:hypothetical protein